MDGTMAMYIESCGFLLIAEISDDDNLPIDKRVCKSCGKPTTNICKIGKKPIPACSECYSTGKIAKA
jgi:protein-arginine kinase activator protein McsA